LDNQAAMRRVLRTIKTLPTRQREALLLRVWEGMNVAETAKAMGCTSGSVKTHLFRGLSKLRETLDIER
ncbi:MAG: sigma-70 family RNA polymerase sigma factor, partial [Gammaproteobacteria bacterium]